MAVTVEDGTIVTGADSYVTRANYITFAASIGITIADDAAADVQLVKAFIYLNGLESALKGIRTLKAQTSAYPRDGLVIEDYSWLNTEIPRQVILAQELLALDINAGIDIYNRPQSASTPIKKVRVEGAVSKEYAVSDAMKMSSVTRTMAVVNSLLINGGFSIAVSRG
tara:strand:+ start:35468 stop:35971 length:504 start_codon:yes stop_codon:yes gene_type:complete